MRFNIPSLPQTDRLYQTCTNLTEAVEKVVGLLHRHPRTLIVTGAGVSVDSGVVSYRGENGLYLNEKFRPIFYHEFVKNGVSGDMFRRRYWARSFMGYPLMRSAQPNETHDILAQWLHQGRIHQLITQNVDRLHHVAYRHVTKDYPPILELHGALGEVRCVSHGTHGVPNSNRLWWDQETTDSFGPVDRYYPTPMAPLDDPHGCGFIMSRDVFQDRLAEINPDWAAWAEKFKTDINMTLQRNPDGDVQLEGVSYETFQYPACPNCGGTLKPDVVLFGENVRKSIRQRSEELLKECDALLLIGTTLATHSAYRLAREASDTGKPIVLINRGPTRADSIVDTRIGLGCSEVLTEVAKHV